MKAKLIKNDDKTIYGWLIRCPACSTLEFNTGLHVVDKRWNFNGDFLKPTFGPDSYKCWYDADNERTAYCCHSNIIDGVMNYAEDCTHNYKNQKLELLDIEIEEN